MKRESKTVVGMYWLLNDLFSIIHMCVRTHTYIIKLYSVIKKSLKRGRDQICGSK